MSSNWFADGDKVFLCSIAAQSFLFDASNTGITAFEELVARLGLNVGVHMPTPLRERAEGDLATSLSGVIDLGERCPACRDPITLSDVSLATCSRGHTWRKSLHHGSQRNELTPPIERCFITSMIMTSSSARTCVTCQRKALQPPSERALPREWENAWVMHTLLEAVQSCLFCGNPMVGIL